MSRKPQDGSIGINVALGSSGTIPEFGVGDVVTCDSGVYVYGSANGAIDEGALCKYTEGSFDFDEVTTAESGTTNTQCGICVTSGGLADNYYGWFWRGRGYEEALFGGSINANTQLTTTATAGVVGTGGDNVDGLFTVDQSASGGGLYTVRAAGLLQTNMTVSAT